MCSVSLGIPVAGLEDAAGLGCGVVAQQDSATVSPCCAFLFRKAGSSAAPDGRREVLMALPRWAQQCCSFGSHIWGAPSTERCPTLLLQLLRNALVENCRGMA